MVKSLQKIAYFTWRHLLTILILCICSQVFYTYEKISFLNSSVLLVVFAAFDYFKTTWFHVDIIQKEHIKKLASFIWRHLLTFGVCSLTLSVFIAGRIPGIEGTIIVSAFAIFIDSLKTGKNSNTPNNIHHQNYKSYKHLHERNYWDSNTVGSPSYLSSIGSGMSQYRY